MFVLWFNCEFSCFEGLLVILFVAKSVELYMNASFYLILFFSIYSVINCGYFDGSILNVVCFEGFLHFLWFFIVFVGVGFYFYFFSILFSNGRQKWGCALCVLLLFWWFSCEFWLFWEFSCWFFWGWKYGIVCGSSWKYFLVDCKFGSFWHKMIYDSIYGKNI